MEPSRRFALKALWDRVVEPLRTELPAAEFDTWIRPLEPLDERDGVVDLAVPNRLFACWIEENFAERLAAAWSETVGRRASFRLRWEPTGQQRELFPPVGSTAPQRELFVNQAPESDANPADEASTRGERGAHRAFAPGGVIARYDFDSFVVGQSNQFARAAAQAVADQPGALYNPFFIFGGVGLGKTHLANAIANNILQKHEDARVVFVSADTFTNRLIDALARNRVQEFKTRMRRVDVLVIDDVQFLAGRERTQEEFFHIFNALYENGRQIVLTADKFPHEIKGLEERLINRFGWGLVADIQPPDVETRMAILGRKAREEGLDVPLNVLSFVAERFESNIRDLEGALTRLSAWASLNRCEITVDLARMLLGEPGKGPAKTITLAEIEARVTSHFGLRPGELQARRRTRKVAEARQIAMYLMRQHGGASFPAIGTFLGGRDHSTVVHGCQTIERRCEQEPRFRSMLETLVRAIGRG